MVVTAGEKKDQRDKEEEKYQEYKVSLLALPQKRFKLDAFRELVVSAGKQHD